MSVPSQQRPHPVEEGDITTPQNNVNSPVVCTTSAPTTVFPGPRCVTHTRSLLPADLGGLEGSVGPSHDLMPLSPICHPLPVIGGFLNMTDLFVPPSISTLLSYGPRFVVPTVTTLMDILDVSFYIHDRFLSKSKQPEDYLRECISQVRERYQAALLPGYSDGPLGVGYMDQLLRGMLDETNTFLRENEDIVLVQSDKGKRIIMMKRTQYNEKMLLWIEGCVTKGFYKIYVGDNFLVEQARIRDAFCAISRRLRATYRTYPTTQKPFPKEVLRMLQRLEVGGWVRLPYLYGLVKDHKPDAPCRPICGTRSWYTYPLQKIVAHILRRVFGEFLLPQNVGDISEVVRRMSEMPVCAGYELVKLDVVDMYTRMNRDKILSSLTMLLATGRYKNYGSICPSLLLECVRFCFNMANYCGYRDTIYRQVCGLPQGACDSGLLATILLDQQIQQHRTLLMENYGIIYFWKYMDDFLLYMPSTSLDGFKNTFQTLTQLELTVECETLSSRGNFKEISFLDLRILRDDHHIYFSVYNKPMASMRMIHYLSKDKLQWKKNTLRNFVQRVLIRTSNRFLYTDLCALEAKFYANMYPRYMVAMTFYESMRPFLVTEVYVGKDPLPPRVIITERFLDRYKDLIASLDRRTINWYECVSKRRLVSSRDRRRRAKERKEQAHALPKPDIWSSIPLINLECDSPVQYCRSIRYRCEGLVGIIEHMFTRNSLGVPVFSKADTLFKRLNMSLAGDPPRIGDTVLQITGPTRVSVFMIGCKECAMLFIFSGTGSPAGMLEHALADKESLLSRHQRVSGHHIQDQLKRLPTVGWLEPEVQLTLYRGLYAALGQQCEMDKVICHIPVYIQRTMERCLEMLEASGSLNCAVLGVPRVRGMSLESP